jgi:phosphoribosylglycinamide formyltransferase-1
VSREAGEPLPIALLISGGGTTLKNILQCIEAGKLDARVALVVSSHPNAGGLAYAREAGVRVEVVQRSESGSLDQFTERVFMPCREAEAELVVMGGFLKHVLIPADFENRVINIHPSLIPAYCGKGFYGHRVHEAVLEAGEATSGCTIHFVDNDYDHGPIILQRQVVVEPDDTPERLASRVFKAECEAYPQVIAWIAAGQVSVEQGQVVVNSD